MAHVRVQVDLGYPVKNLAHPRLRDAGAAGGRIGVADGARANDAARRQRAGARQVGNHLAKVKHRLLAGMGRAKPFAVQVDAHRQLQHRAPPGLAQGSRSDGNGRKAGGGLALVETEAARQLGRDQAAQRHIVQQYHQRDTV